MIFTIYKRALAVLMKRPFALWGISLLEVILTGLVTMLFGAVPGIALGINLLLNTSMTMIFLHGYRGDGVATVQLFDCFKDGATAKRVLGGMLWMDLWVFLWGLIPIAGPIFTIIKTYEYRLTPYILVTEPEISATEAIKVSSKRTKGWKGMMFGADILLPVVVALIILILLLLASIPYIGVLFGLILFVFVVCCMALYPLYFGLIQAAFYEEIKNPTPIAPRPARPRYVDPPVSGAFCPHCGAPLPADSNFCTNCGTKLK
ncbi:MAG: zinc ribbon domain-containing protein [Oscillospiraceae bacterium]|nr:zinc ribbon domain-containing protein [Oscillospiraceae bacterium]